MYERNCGNKRKGYTQCAQNIYSTFTVVHDLLRIQSKRIRLHFYAGIYV